MSSEKKYVKILWYSFKSIHSFNNVLIEIKKIIIIITKFSNYHCAFGGVEKLNDDCRGIHLQRSNKWDAPIDVLLPPCGKTSGRFI